MYGHDKSVTLSISRRFRAIFHIIPPLPVNTPPNFWHRGSFSHSIFPWFSWSHRAIRANMDPTSRRIAETSQSAIRSPCLFCSSVLFFAPYVPHTHYLWFVSIRISHRPHVLGDSAFFLYLCGIWPHLPISVSSRGRPRRSEILLFITILSSLFMWRYCFPPWLRWRWSLMRYQYLYMFSDCAAVFILSIFGKYRPKLAVYWTYIISH